MKHMFSYHFIFYYILLSCNFLSNGQKAHAQQQCNFLPVSTTGYSIKHCPIGWTRYKNEKCFKLFTEPKTFANAESSCSELGSTLASFQSEDENHFLLSLIVREVAPDKLIDVWVGAKKVSVWFWMDLSKFSNVNWWPGHPIKESCGRLCTSAAHINHASQARGRLADQVCSTVLHYICQKFQIDTRMIHYEN